MNFAILGSETMPFANFIINTQKSAIIMLDAGPAIATIAISFRGERRLLVFTGIGFAQPKINPVKT